MTSDAYRFFESLMRLTMLVKSERSIGNVVEKRRSPPVVMTAASSSISLYYFKLLPINTFFRLKLKFQKTVRKNTYMINIDYCNMFTNLN